MGSLVLIRKVGDVVRVYNAAKTRFYEIELMNIGQDGVLLTISHNGNSNTAKILFNVPQLMSAGHIEMQRKSNMQVKMLFDFPRDISVVRKELIK